jgi:hypothetical protein
MLKDQGDLQALRRIGVQPGKKERSLSCVPGGRAGAQGEMVR